MLNKVKLELDTFDINVEDLDLIDQVVGDIEKLLEVSFFQARTITFGWLKS